MTTDAVIDQNDVIASVLSPAFSTTHPFVENHDSIPASVRDATRYTLEQRFFSSRDVRVISLNDVYVVGEGLVFDKEQRLYTELLSQQAPQTIAACRAELSSAIEAGDVIDHADATVLCVKPGWQNIGHWLIEMLPMADLARQALGHDLRVLIDNPGSSVGEAILFSLASIGVELREIDQHTHHPQRFKQLVLVSGLTVHSFYMSPLVMKTLDKVAAGVKDASVRKLYVSRTTPSYRRFANESEVCRLMREAGLQVFGAEAYSFEESIGLFKGADLVLSTANAALARICFCKPGTRVVVFYPFNMADTFFWFIAQLRGLEYVEVRCAAAGPSKTHLPWDSDVTLPREDLLRLAGYTEPQDNGSMAYSGSETITETGSDLVAIAARYGTDKEGTHWYGRRYARHFEPFRNRSFNLLEIGVGGYQDPLVGGASLRMWKEYFPHANIVGLDIFDKWALTEDRIRIYQGSQDDRDLINRIFLECGGFDLIVDDGSHICKHVIETFIAAFPLLNHGGIYAVEDLQTSYWPKLGGSSVDLTNPATSMGFFKKLVDGLNFEEFELPGFSPDYYARNIVAMHFYHNLVFIEKGHNDEKSNVAVNNVLPEGLRSD